MSEIPRWVKISALSVAVFMSTGGLLFEYKRRQRKFRARQQWNSVGRDVVVLHQFPRNKNCINLSPYPIKLETYLRMNGISYVCDFEYYTGPKGKSPWITINGQDVADSQLALEHLARHFDIDMSKDLNLADRAVARAMRTMLEDHAYWSFLVQRWVYGRGKPVKALMAGESSGCLKSFMWDRILENVAKKMEKCALSQGMARHSRQDVLRFGQEDIQAISDFLGDKSYLMGGESPTEVDCTVFGFLYLRTVSQVGFETTFPNLSKYVERIINRYYPDLEQLLEQQK